MASPIPRPPRRDNRPVEIGAASPPLRVREAGPDEREDWDRFVTRRCRGILMQSWGWGELRRRYGWRVSRLLAEDGADSEWRGALQVLYRSVGPAGVSWAYAPRGPALPPGPLDLEAAAALLQAARARLRPQRVAALRLDPEWGQDATAVEVRRRLRLREAAFDVQHRRTWLVDLRGGAAAVSSRLPPSTRRNIRLAERAEVRVDHSGGPDAVDTFYRLHLETVSRQGFQTRPLDYYRAAVDALGAEVFTARLHQVPVAAAVAVACGPRLVYLYGGSSPSSSRAPYALHWAMIEWGLSQGCELYDMWGVPSHFEEGDPGPGYAVFKTRWGGHLAAHSGLLLAPWLGPLDPAIHRAERWLLRRRPLLT